MIWILSIIALIFIWNVCVLADETYPRKKLYEAFIEGRSLPVKKLTSLYVKRLFVPKHEYNKGNLNHDIVMDRNKDGSFQITGTGTSCSFHPLDLNFRFQNYFGIFAAMRGSGLGLYGKIPEMRAPFLSFGLWITPWTCMMFIWNRPVAVNRVGVMVSFWSWRRGYV